MSTKQDSSFSQISVVTTRSNSDHDSQRVSNRRKKGKNGKKPVTTSTPNRPEGPTHHNELAREQRNNKARHTKMFTHSINDDKTKSKSSMDRMSGNGYNRIKTNRRNEKSEKQNRDLSRKGNEQFVFSKAFSSIQSESASSFSVEDVSNNSVNNNNKNGKVEKNGICRLTNSEIKTTNINHGHPKAKTAQSITYSSSTKSENSDENDMYQGYSNIYPYPNYCMPPSTSQRQVYMGLNGRPISQDYINHVVQLHTPFQPFIKHHLMAPPPAGHFVPGYYHPMLHNHHVASGLPMFHHHQQQRQSFMTNIAPYPLHSYWTVPESCARIIHYGPENFDLPGPHYQ